MREPRAEHVSPPGGEPGREWATGPAAGPQLSVAGVAAYARRHRVLFAALPLGLAALAAGISLSSPRTYTSQASFMPSSEKRQPALANLAARFGMMLPGGAESGESASFYAALLTSRELLTDAAVEKQYQVRRRGTLITGSFAELSDVEGESPAVIADRAIRRLREAISVRTAAETGIVSFSVETRDPELSRQVSSRLLDLVSEFNLQKRQSQAGAERSFVEARLQEVQRDLRATEDRLEDFLQQNRAFQRSPQLTFEYERLKREVEMRQEIYTSLAGAFEQARMDQVRNTPVITVLDRPSVAVRPNGRWTILKAGLGFGAGLLIALGLAVAGHLRHTDRTARDEAWLSGSGAEWPTPGAGARHEPASGRTHR